MVPGHQQHYYPLKVASPRLFPSIGLGHVTRRGQWDTSWHDVGSILEISHPILCSAVTRRDTGPLVPAIGQRCAPGLILALLSPPWPYPWTMSDSSQGRLGRVEAPDAGRQIVTVSCHWSHHITQRKLTGILDHQAFPTSVPLGFGVG